MQSLQRQLLTMFCTSPDPNAVPDSPPCIIGALTPLHITEGSKARFRATVTGYPTPALAWQLDGKPIVTSDRVQVSPCGKLTFFNGPPPDIYLGYNIGMYTATQMIFGIKCFEIHLQLFNECLSVIARTGL